MEPKLLIMNVVEQKATRSGLRDRTISILWSSLQALSQSPKRKQISIIGGKLWLEELLENMEYGQEDISKFAERILGKSY